MIDQRVISPCLAQRRHDEPEMAFSVFGQDLAHGRDSARLPRHGEDIRGDDLDVIFGADGADEGFGFNLCRHETISAFYQDRSSDRRFAFADPLLVTAGR